MSTAANAEARIQSVSVTDDEITERLLDGRPISAPWLGHGGSPKRLPNSVRGLRSSGAAPASTGPRSTTSVWKGCSTEFREKANQVVARLVDASDPFSLSQNPPVPFHPRSTYSVRTVSRKNAKLGELLCSTSIRGDISSAHFAFSAPIVCQPFRESAFAPPG